MEDALYEIESMRRFAGIELHAIPDETTILNFRRFIEDNNLSVLILDKVNQHLSRKVLLLKTGTIVAPLLNCRALAPPRTNLVSVILRRIRPRKEPSGTWA
jgi:IS5 family transposase